MYANWSIPEQFTKTSVLVVCMRLWKNLISILSEDGFHLATKTKVSIWEINFPFKSYIHGKLAYFSLPHSLEKDCEKLTVVFVEHTGELCSHQAGREQ